MNGQVVLGEVSRATALEGYFGLLARGDVDFEVNEVRLFPGRNRPEAVALSNLVVAMPMGHTLRKPDGTEIPAFYRARIDPASRKTVVLKFRGELPEDAVLWYGWGLDPYCNLTDRANMAAPVFGPMEIR